MPRKVYVASSWRNLRQPMLVNILRDLGHQVYDFRNPAPGNHGFKWEEVDREWQSWTVERYIDSLSHPIAEKGFLSDREAMEWADTCVLLLPSGRSAHIEAGWMKGHGKDLRILIPSDVGFEPELMYKLADGVYDQLSALLAVLGEPS